MTPPNPPLTSDISNQTLRHKLRILFANKLFRWLLTIVIVSIAITLTWHEIHSLNWHLVRSTVIAADVPSLILAIVLTGCAIATMGLYDAIAFPAGKANLSFLRRWVTGMFVFSWANVLSLGGATGPALRLLLYKRLGLSTSEVAQGLGVHYFAASFGLFGWLVAVLFPLPASLGAIQMLAAQAAIALLTSLLLAYLFGHQLSPLLQKLLRRHYPEADLSQANLPLLASISFLDWTLAFLVFQTLVMAVDPAASFFPLSKAYFVGIGAGIASLLPGGVGAADMVWLHFLHDQLGATGAAAAILLERVIFYLLPWGLSAVLAYIYLARQTLHLQHWHRRIVATSITVGAFILLVSTASPAIPERMHWLTKFTPISVIEISHLLSVISAVILLYLAGGLLKGYRSALLTTLGILAASIVTHVLKGADFEESFLSLSLMFLLLLSANSFQRRGALQLGWELVLTLFLGSFFLYLFTGFTAFENITYHEKLWTRFSLNADASRFLRGLPVLIAIGIFFITRQAMMPRAFKCYAGPEDINRALVIINQHSDSADPLLIGGTDKNVWFWTVNGIDRGVVLYQTTANDIVIFKDPVVDSPAARADLVRDFMRFVEDADLDPVFSMVSVEWMDVLHDFGFHFIKLTQEAIVDLTQFSLQGSQRAAMRHTLNNCEKKAISFNILMPPHSQQIIEQCREVSDNWLQVKGGEELQFSACYFSEPYLQRNPLGVATDRDGKIVAFVNVLITRQGGPATFDFMRYKPGIVNNLMDYVIIKTALYCQQVGASSLSLGGAALSNVGKEKGGQLLERGLRFFSLRAEKLYNYQGLFQYKNKFKPNWQPRYLAYQKPYDWASAIHANLQIVKPSRNDKKRIKEARISAE